MSIQITELSDNRTIGFGVFEVASFPIIEGSTKDLETELEQSYNLFLHAIKEFYKLGIDSNTVAELFWVGDKAEKQTFKSRIRIFCVVRRIGVGNLKLEIEQLLNHFSIVFSSKQFKVEMNDNKLQDFTDILSQVNKECLFTVIKSEKCAGNSSSMYPYYYCDVVPTNNVDNFASIVTALSQYENCAISFQIFPTQLTQQEKYYLNEVTAELGRLTTGVFMQRGLVL